ncbi:MAG: hypothetical protein NTZ74_14995 [Chloroflexi bacterium]|nr:hypothetical protein [Chloroflexota bacterium]
MSVPSLQTIPLPVRTVQGPLSFEQLGITDAHNHLWIAPVAGADPRGPVLNEFSKILEELTEYKNSGGNSLLDCQPEGCGRDGNQLFALSENSGVNIIACTGFHLKKYYPENHWLWKIRSQKVCDFLCSEMEQGLFETLQSPAPVKAGFIKIALEATWSESPRAALEGAAYAAVKSKSLLEIHTEKGSLAEKACIYLTDLGVLPQQLVLCHMDKRPDLGLHREFARLGVLLEYDTFYRPKYSPEKNLWPLLEQMIQAGFADRITLATDMAESNLYHSIGGGPGLHRFPGEIQNQLREIGVAKTAVLQLLGGNISRRLAGLV